MSGEEADSNPSDTNLNNRMTMMAKNEKKKRNEEAQPDQLIDSISVTSFFCGCGGLDLGFRGDFDYKGQKFPRTDFSILIMKNFERLCQVLMRETAIPEEV